VDMIRCVVSFKKGAASKKDMQDYQVSSSSSS